MIDRFNPDTVIHGRTERSELEVIFDIIKENSSDIQDLVSTAATVADRVFGIRLEKAIDPSSKPAEPNGLLEYLRFLGNEQSVIISELRMHIYRLQGL